MPIKIQIIEEKLFEYDFLDEELIAVYEDELKLPFIFGTAEGDGLSGTSGRDWIYAGDGDDSVRGGDGDDLLKGEAGNDRLYGDEGNDLIDGGSGDDRLIGGLGDDRLKGASGDDDIWGNEGDDIIYGDYEEGDALGSGDDYLSGGEGNDIIFGGGGNDRIAGGEGEDVIQGGAGDDILWGEAYEDPEFPPQYINEADTFVFSEDSWGNDTIRDFDDGLDLLDFSQHARIHQIEDFDSISQVGNDTVISYTYVNGNLFGGNNAVTSTITLTGIDVDDISDADFIF